MLFYNGKNSTFGVCKLYVGRNVAIRSAIGSFGRYANRIGRTQIRGWYTVHYFVAVDYPAIRERILGVTQLVVRILSAVDFNKCKVPVWIAFIDHRHI